MRHPSRPVELMVEVCTQLNDHVQRRAFALNAEGQVLLGPAGVIVAFAHLHPNGTAAVTLYRPGSAGTHDLAVDRLGRIACATVWKLVRQYAASAPS